MDAFETILESSTFKGAGGQIPLASWARFFLLLGYRVALQRNDPRLVVGISVPTRAYSAVLAAAGIVAGRASCAFQYETSKSHVERISRINVGSPVILFEGNRRYPGVFQGIRQGNDLIARIAVQLQSQEGGKLSRGLTSLIPIDQAHRVIESHEETLSLPADPPKGLPVKAASHFLDGLCGVPASEEGLRGDGLSCLIFGNKGQLENEATSAEIAIRVRGRNFSAKLDSVIKTNKKSSWRNDCYTFVCASRGSRLSRATISLRPHVTVFDGATGFLKWRDDFRSSNWIVILDRTDPYFEEGVAQLNAEYAGNCLEGESEFPLPTPLASIEVTSFWEAL